MITVLQGDCRDVLRTLPDASVHCCVTSPPYWGLREYGTAKWEGGDPAHVHDTVPARGGLGGGGAAGKQSILPASVCSCGAARIDQQIGQELSPEAFVAELVGVFREVWRVLRPDGTVWVNMGDCYAADGKWGGETGGEHAKYLHGGESKIGRERRTTGLKSGDLVGIPWMVAFALRADGWWLRQDNLWAKRNCMPESTRNRTTRAHEYIFQLAKSGEPLFWTHRERDGTRKRPEADYRWVHRDTGQEVAECPPGWPEAGKKTWGRVNLYEGHNYFYDATAIAEDGEIAAGTRAAKGSVERAKQANSRPPEYAVYTGKRNKRSVWWMATQPFAEAHFATFPPELPETCIKAGTSERGCCPGCGAPWTRVTEKFRTFESGSGRAGNLPVGKNGAGLQGGGETLDVRRGPVVTTTTAGWRPTCDCPPHEPVPCTVLDPFAGAFTTCMVADRLGADTIGIELNPEYCDMARRRLVKDAGMFADIRAAAD